NGGEGIGGGWLKTEEKGEEWAAAGLDGGCERRTWRLLVHAAALTSTETEQGRGNGCSGGEAGHGDADLDRAAAEEQRRGLAS
ncbi:hypothetical protein Csa_023875, partial [Cucumis sativus]